MNEYLSMNEGLSAKFKVSLIKHNISLTVSSAMPHYCQCFSVDKFKSH